MKYDVSLQTIAWINGRRNDGTLEISPKFQRRPVWMETERSAGVLLRIPSYRIVAGQLLQPGECIYRRSKAEPASPLENSRPFH